jgi:hypothetical protein
MTDSREARMNLSRSQLAVIVVGVAVVALTAPAAAETMVDFARNAGHVNGISAVHAGASVSGRGGKLIAANRSGHLPNNIVKKVPQAGNAQRLAGRSDAAYARLCDQGAVLGSAVVPADVSSSYQDVAGFASRSAPPHQSTNCHLGSPQAERISPGVFRVHLAQINDPGANCSDIAAGDAAVVISPRSDSGTPLTATYRPVCDTALIGNVVDEVHITDLTGTPTDATFAIELIATGGVPAP